MLLASSADQHLDFQRFAGARSALRKQDFFCVFRAWVDEVLRRKPDVATFAGDLFDSPDPGNEALFVAVSQIIRLIEADIEVVMVSGNHDTPKSSRSHIYSVLAQLPIHCCYQKIEETTIKGVKFVTVPWFDGPLDWENVPSGDVLVVHTTCAESPAVNPDRNFADIPGDTLRWLYSALGDWHQRFHAAPTALYPGALERCSFGEEQSCTGGVFVDFMIGWGVSEYDFWDSPSRQMVTLSVDLEALVDPTKEINSMLEEHSDACVRLQMRGYSGLVDVQSLEWHPLLQKEFVGEHGVAGPQFIPSNMQVDWETFCDAQEIGVAVRRYGRRFLR